MPLTALLTPRSFGLVCQSPLRVRIGPVLFASPTFARNAAGVPASTSLVPTQIFSFLSISASQSLALNNPQQAVAFVLPGLQFDVRTCAGSSSGIPRAWVQCVSEPGGSNTLFNDPNAAGPFGAQLGLRFREGFQTAFKTRIDPAQIKSVPGVVYNTESGFVRDDQR